MSGPIRISILANATRAKSEIRSVGTEAEGMGKRVLNAGKLIAGAFVATGAVEAVKDIVTQTREAAKADKQTAAVLKSTGNAARISATGVEDLAKAISEKTAVDDDQIQSGENVLLTFKNVRNEVGKGNQVFNQATKVAVDMAAALNHGEVSADSLKTTNILLGKALNDPVKGITALTRVGVTLDAQQKAAIKTDEARNDSLGAQKIVLKELRSEFKGSAAANADSLDMLKVHIDDLEKELGKKLLPTVENVAKYLLDHEDAYLETGKAIGEQLAPEVHDLAKYAQSAASFISGLPSPVKRFGIEAGIAYLAVGRLNKALAESKTVAFVSGLTNAETRTQTLGSALRTTAGVGGMLALYDASRRTAGGLSSLEDVAGGAALGFSTGFGPAGAVVGAVAGGMLAIYRAVHKAGGAFHYTSEQGDALRDTLDQQTGAITKNTREWLLNELAHEKAGKGVSALQRLLSTGLTRATIANAISGGPNAMALVNTQLNTYQAKLAAIQKQITSHNEAIAAAGGVRGRDTQLEALTKQYDAVKAQVTALDSIANRATGVKKQQHDMLLAAAAAGEYNKGLKALPKIVQTEIRANHLQLTKDQATGLAQTYAKTPKQVQTIFKFAGISESLADAKKVLKGIKDIQGAGSGAQAAVAVGLGKVGSTRANMSPFVNSVKSGVDSAKGVASSGSHQVGVDLKAGLLGGIGGLGAALAAQISAAVHEGIAAGRKAADAHSPSRKTEQLGQDMSDGLRKGLSKDKAKAIADLKTQITNLIEQGYTKSLDAQAGKVIAAAKRLGKKGTQAIQAALKSEAASLKSAMDDAVSQFNDAVASHISSVQDTYNSFADITGFMNSDAALTTDSAASSIVANLQQKVTQAQQYTALLQQLMGEGLNATTVNQLLAAGPDQGFSTAQAIASGGQQTVNQINALQSQLSAASTSLGTSTATAMYDAGIASAQGLIDGIQSKEAALVDVATQMGKKFAKAIKKALGINSPSKVMKQVGINTTQGFQIGTQTPDLKSTASRLANDFTGAFGTPQIGSAAFSSSGSFPDKIVITSAGLSQLLRGQQISQDLTAYKAAGGRS